MPHQGELACLTANGNFATSAVKDSPWDVANPQGRANKSGVTLRQRDRHTPEWEVRFRVTKLCPTLHLAWPFLHRETLP